MSGGIDIEVLLVAAYAIFLIALAACLELAARHSHRRSERAQLAGFRYERKLDLWTCPNDQKLFRAEEDYRRRVVVYRAQAHACNACSMKMRCTNSDNGRSIEHAPDSWLHSELRRFHRAISLVLFAVSTALVLSEMFRYQGGRGRFLLAATAGVIVAGGLRLSAAFMAQESSRRGLRKS